MKKYYKFTFYVDAESPEAAGNEIYEDISLLKRSDFVDRVEEVKPDHHCYCEECCSNES